MVIVSLAGKELTSVKPALVATFFMVAIEKAVPIAFCQMVMVSNSKVFSQVIPGMD